MDRKDEQARFLSAAGWGGAMASPLAGDASARRYFRLSRGDGTQTAVLMDAPPESGQDIEPFLDMTHYLRNAGLSAPAILSADRNCGLLLLEDLGDAVFARIIDHDPARETALYEAAVDLLLDLHTKPASPGLATLSGQSLADAVDLALSMYAAPFVATHRRDIDRLTTLVRDALGRIPPHPPVTALRDFHAENLIWLPEREGSARVGLLDYQDAFAGHPAYDLVSLLADARRDVAPALRQKMVTRYIAGSGLDADTFGFACAALSAQRNLRILGVFARLSSHLGKPQYAELIPRVWRYLVQDLEAPGLEALKECVDGLLPEPSPNIIHALQHPDPQDPAVSSPPVMLFAAGFGTRMRDLTATAPKPLLPVAEKPLLAHALDLTAEARIAHRVVNTHYLGKQISDHLAARPDIVISHEDPDILDTGGGLANALPLLGTGPVFTMNTDAVWTGRNPFRQLRDAWDPAQMDGLLLLVDPARARSHSGNGDFLTDENGRLRRGPGGIYTGAQIIRTGMLGEIPQTVFSLNLIWDRMLEEGRLYGIWHHGGWCDVGHPEGIGLAEEMLDEACSGPHS